MAQTVSQYLQVAVQLPTMFQRTNIIITIFANFFILSVGDRGFVPFTLNTSTGKRSLLEDLLATYFIDNRPKPFYIYPFASLIFYLQVLNLISLIRECNIFLNPLKVYQSWPLKGSNQTLLQNLSLFLIEYIKPGEIQKVLMFKFRITII